MIAFIDVMVNGKQETLEISETTAESLKVYNDTIVKAGMVPINDRFNYYWIRNRYGDVLAFAGVHFKKDRAIFKAAYTFPLFRKNGLWKTLFEYRKFICESRPEIKAIEAVCTRMSIGLYVKYDAEIVKKFKSDLWQVRIPLKKD